MSLKNFYYNNWKYKFELMGVSVCDYDIWELED